MSTLLKSGSGRVVRRFSGDSTEPRQPDAVSTPTIDPRDLEIARLAAELERLAAARTKDAADATQRVEAARREGHKQGLADAQADDKARLAALRAGLEAAVEAFEARLAVLDGLAPALVRGALAKLFDSFEDWRPPLEAAVGRQLQALGETAVVMVRVSAQDFPDTMSLEGVSERLALNRAKLVVDAGLRAGASRIECRLGQVDVDVRDQWQTLAALLEDMAR